MFFELFTSLMQTAGPLGGLFDFMNPAFSCDHCTGSAFTAKAAAMATQGYWAQADIIEFLQFSSFKDLAILFYVCSAAGGLISMALGMPPKLYLWFFMGPPLYQFLLVEPAYSNGTRWEVAKQVQNQSDVWKLAYTGIQNTRAFQDTGVSLKSFQNPFTGENIYIEPAGGGAKVSWFFAYFDIIVSSVVQNLISWFGPYSAIPGSAGGLRLGNGDGSWHLMTDEKWGILETITSARITDAALRDVLVTFLSSECGDRFRGAVNIGNLTQANSAKGRNLPRGGANDTTVFWSATEVARVTNNYSIPTPSTLGALFRDGAKGTNPKGMPGSFLKATGLGTTIGLNGSTDVLSRFGAAQMTTCSQLLYSIMVGVRWEAGHTYARLMAQAPSVVPSGDGFLAGLASTAMQMTPGMVTSILFYGWEIPGSTGSFNFNLGGLGDVSTIPNPQRDEAQQQFLLNLITTHIIKNELAVAPPVMTQRGSDSNESANISVIYASTVGSKSKFGELYVWALMMPYLQGIFLYFLAIAYPFVTMAMVVPGWHKMFFSWMTFWVWVKLWDVGFAIVAMAERSIWATLGNSSDAAAVFQRVNEMSNFGKIDVKCVTGSILGGAGGLPGQVPCQGNQVVDVLVSGARGATMSLSESIRMLDLAMLLGASMDLDRANAFYIYFMAALKFAVPVVCGQLVLGSKAAVAGMVKDFTGASADAGRAAGSAFSAQKTAQASANAASQAQAASLKAMRQQGLGLQAMRAGNAALQRGFEAQALGQHAQGLQAMSGQLNNAQQYNRAGLELSAATGKVGFAPQSVLSFMGYGSAAKGLQSGKGQQSLGGNGVKIDYGDLGAQGLAAAPEMGKKISEAKGAGKGYSSPSAASGNRASANNQQSANGQLGPNRQGNSIGPASSPGGRAISGGNASSGGGGVQAPGLGGSMVPGAGGSGEIIAGLWAAKGIGDSFMDSYYGPGRLTMDMIQSMGGADMTRGMTNASADLSAWQSQYGIKGFEARSQADGMNLLSDRSQAAAVFGAQQAAWLDRANYANAAAGTLAAFGVQPGVISAGQKPDDLKGASWLGQLGTNAQDEARFVEQSGAYFQQVSDKFNQLSNAYGYDSLMSTYTNNKKEAGEMFGRGMGTFAYYSWASMQDKDTQKKAMARGPQYEVEYQSPASRK